MRGISRFSHHARRVLVGAALSLLLLFSASLSQAAQPGQPKPGGTVRIGMWQEGGTLNPYFVSQAAVLTAARTTFEGLQISDPDGTYVPVLAEEIPSQTNGDVSADGTVVTWKLKHGLIWSDGQPFTSQDVLFTYNMIMDPSNPIANRPIYAVMQSVTAPDDYTVVVTYPQLFAAYRGVFPWILPAHVFGGRTSISQDPFNRAPTVGTGPFVFKSWASGDAIEFDRNPNYRDVGRPYVDQVIYKITPSVDAAVQALEAGDLDVVWNLDETYISQFKTITDASIDPIPWRFVEKLYLNVSCSSGPQQGDPACPHPVLSDVRVRQAIALAIDKQTLTHSLLYDLVKPTSTIIPVGPYAVDPGVTEYSPDKARQLLDQAGWTPGTDGVRVKNGVRAHLIFSTTTGDNFRLQEQQLIQQNLQSIGIETEIRNYPNLSAGFAGGSPLSLGTFDIALNSLGTGTQADPLASLLSFYGTSNISSVKTQSGNNYTRLGDPLLDDALTAAGNTLDEQARLAAFLAAARVVQADAAHIPLFPRLLVEARKNDLVGWRSNVFDYLSWNAQDWWLNR